jgi:hypothetical protein
MIAWLIRLLSAATTGNTQNPGATTDGRPAETPSQRERPLVVDDSTAMAELIRLLDKQSKAGKSKTKREDQSDS